jgi:DNA-binding transcriptional ArsR family regulator
MQEQIGNFRHTTETSYFPSWEKGEEKRQAILKLLEKNPELSIEQIAKAINLSKAQVRRHRSRLISDCLWKVCSAAIVLSATFAGGAYWADPNSVEEAIESLISSAIEVAENAVWSIEQKSL